MTERERVEKLVARHLPMIDQRLGWQTWGDFIDFPFDVLDGLERIKSVPHYGNTTNSLGTAFVQGPATQRWT